jgi:glutaredoxin
MITVYSKEDCVQCLQVENLLKIKNKEFEVKKLDKDYSREYLENVFTELGLPQPRSFPVVFKGSNLIGGLKEIKMLVAKGTL